MDRKIGICIVGYGGFGRKLHGYLSKMDECEVKYLYHPNKEKALLYGELGCWDLEKILADDSVDAFVIATPNDQHFKMLGELLFLNKHHIFVEKPMVVSYAEALALPQLVEMHTKVLMVGHCYRRESVYRKAKELLDAGTIGKIVNINFNYSSPKAFTIRENDWRASATRNDLGPLAMVGSHCIDTVHYLFGKAESVYAQLRNLSGKTEAPDTSSVMMNMENGATVFLQCHYNVPGEKYCFISGTEGGIYVERDKIWLRLGREAYKSAPSEKKELTVAKVDPIEEELKEFLDAIRTGREVETGYQEGLEVVRVLEACRKSAKENKVIRLP